MKIISTHSKDMIRYISEFPFDQYEIKEISSFGREIFFYIDVKKDCIKSCLDKGEAWEKRISQYIVKYALPGSNVIDVGAHIGTHALTMAYCVGNKGRVFAFEPQPKIFRELFLNLRINLLKNISCIWGAAGAKKGTIEIGPLAAGNEGATPLIKTSFSSGKWSSKVIGGTGVFVDVIAIDSLKLDKVSLIKIDVERMENRVLEGARETIRKNKPVIILEIMGGWVPEAASASIIAQIEYTKRIITDLGYDLKRIDDWDYLALPKKIASYA
jgi:FkbM family methyltransferase